MAPAAEMQTFAGRLASFEGPKQVNKRRASSQKKKQPTTSSWPHETPSPTQLAKAGFFYHPSSSSPDSVTCFLCEKALDGWNTDDNPAIEHLNHVPDCGWAINCCIEQRIEDMDRVEEDPLSEKMVESRRATYRDWWPHESKKGWKCKTKKMVDAGWCYTPIPEADDCVTCFYCGASLEGWEPKDDAWQEHRKRAPDCHFFSLVEENMQLKKGTKSKKGRTSRTSKASRLSVQSHTTAPADDSVIALDEDPATEEGDSMLSTATTASKAGKGRKKAAKPKGPTRQKRDTAQAVEDAVNESTLSKQLEAEVEQELEALEAEEEPVDERPKKTRSRKNTRASTQSESASTKAKSTRAKKGVAKQTVPKEQSPEPEPEPDEDIHQEPAPIAAPKPTRGRKRMSDGSEKEQDQSIIVIVPSPQPEPTQPLEDDTEKPKPKSKRAPKKMVEPKVSEQVPSPPPPPKTKGKKKQPAKRSEEQEEGKEEDAGANVVEDGPEETLNYETLHDSHQDEQPAEPRQEATPPPADTDAGHHSPTPQSSDAENQPPSSNPSSSKRKTPVLAPVSQTPKTSPSKRNVIAGDQLSKDAWKPIDLEGVFLPSPSLAHLADKDSFNIETIIQNLTAHEKAMSVEDWIKKNAGQAENRLRQECERMIGKFEDEGNRALNSMEGIECA